MRHESGRDRRRARHPCRGGHDGGRTLTLCKESTFTFPSPPRDGGVEFSRVSSIRNGTMKAFFSVNPPSQLVLNRGKLMLLTAGRYWISIPSSLQRDKYGNVVVEPRSKPRYEQHAEFADRAAMNRIEELVIGALCEAHPELFDGSAA
jgi:hypothetical protein